MTAELTELNRVAADLSPEQVRKVIEYAKLVSKPYWERPGYSDEWTDEDMQDAANASMRAFDEEHPGEDWSHLRPANPGGYK
jgi:hypothetical protein